jgi:hypothetical protein
MPGLIGASIFSPFPARGYRFQSLHFEIIIAPNAQAPQQSSRRNSNALSQQLFQRSNPHRLPQPYADRTPAMQGRGCGNIAAFSISARPVSRLHHEPAIPHRNEPLPLAGNRAREEDRPFEKEREVRHAKQR